MEVLILKGAAPAMRDLNGQMEAGSFASSGLGKTKNLGRPTGRPANKSKNPVIVPENGKNPSQIQRGTKRAKATSRPTGRPA
jgi:hypothetical protein